MAITSEMSRYSGLPQVINKTVTNTLSKTGVFKQPLSVMNPVFEIQGQDVIQGLSNGSINYMKIEGKYYYVMDVKYINNNMAEVSLHMDVLMTYKTQINNLDVLLERSSTPTNKNVRDGSYPLSSEQTYEVIDLPNGYSEFEEDGVYVMVTNQNGYEPYTP